MFGLFFCLIQPLYGQEKEHVEHDEHSESHEQHLHKHHISILNGATTNVEHDLTSYTIGGDYEYHLKGNIGVTAILEFVGGDADELVSGLGLVYHTKRGFKLTAAPLIVYAKAKDNEVHQNQEEESSGKSTIFAFRTGLAYDFLIGNLSIGPVLNLDFGKERAINYGLVIGYGF